MTDRGPTLQDVAQGAVDNGWANEPSFTTFRGCLFGHRGAVHEVWMRLDGPEAPESCRGSSVSLLTIWEWLSGERPIGEFPEEDDD